MKQGSALRWWAAILSVLVLVFGLGSIHYTTVPKAEHHAEWALAHDMPEPNFTIFVIGAIATVLGAGMSGFMLGARRGRRS